MSKSKQKSHQKTDLTEQAKLTAAVENTFAALEQLSDFFSRLRKS